MDRIDTQAPKGVAASLREKGAPQVAAPEPARPEAAAAGVPVSSVVSAGAEAPVDQDRVAEIRKAVEEGRYPLVPAKIADAMIASGFMLRIRG
jgi:negative regulator of flagellin synthesis FlgM